MVLFDTVSLIFREFVEIIKQYKQVTSVFIGVIITEAIMNPPELL